MKSFKHKCFFAVYSFITVCHVGISQTSNIGDLFIKDGTIFSSISQLVNLPSGNVINDGDMYLYSDLQNNGAFNFSQNSLGTVLFEGPGSQILDGANTIYFNKVIFNSTSTLSMPFSIDNEINVDSEANLVNGIIEVVEPAGKVVFENNAIHSGNYEQSFFQGSVQKIGNDEFMFPIGDIENYRYARISSPLDSTDAFSARYFLQDIDNTTIPSLAATSTINVVDSQEYWHITKDTGTSDVILTLPWNENGITSPEVIVEPKSAIHIIRWDATQQLWVDEGGVVDEGTNTVTTPVKLDQYGFFTLGRINDSQLLTDDMIFNGVTPNGDNKNDYFIIEGIQNLNNNNVQVYNRWGVQVFQTDNYDSFGNVFNGYSENTLTLNGNDQLPTGTYYYVITYEVPTDTGDVINEKKVGYLYLTTE